MKGNDFNPHFGKQARLAPDVNQGVVAELPSCAPEACCSRGKRLVFAYAHGNMLLGILNTERR